MVSDEYIFEKVKQILSKTFKIDSVLIREDANLVDDLGLDSIELMDAIGFAEAQFKIKLVKNGLADIQEPIITVRDLIALISQKMKETVKR
ncbi:MAG: hypothetical protein A2987_06865 [Omnitrophica bacterium RIFCSPLOWO2_01_FULL_45_10]|nr:MAG: hypothetical protein A2987_06865 [Omnitrophica bacterium RIFCSPLOWO2_01_FULL_45_10]